MEVEGLNAYGWEHIFHDLEIPRNGFEDVFTEASSLPATEAIDSWIEELLVKDDGEQTSARNDCFTWSDLLVDSPNENFQVSDEQPPTEVKSSPNASESEGNLVDATKKPIDYDYKSNDNGDDNTRNFKSNGENDKSGDDVLEGNGIDSDADPLSKKRKRQLRNRDAAMKSRERKKIYVKDLEMKSRYMEAECRRLGRLLQCCYAENQMLRISLSNAYGASLTKPESAVLLLGMNLTHLVFIFLFIFFLFNICCYLSSDFLRLFVSADFYNWIIFTYYLVKHALANDCGSVCLLSICCSKCPKLNLSLYCVSEGTIMSFLFLLNTHVFVNCSCLIIENIHTYIMVKWS